MHSFIAAQSAGSADLWECLQAIASVSDAIAALDAAGATLVGLTADTEWAADGVRALHEKLIIFDSAAAVEIGRLHARVWELRGAVT